MEASATCVGVITSAHPGDHFPGPGMHHHPRHHHLHRRHHHGHGPIRRRCHPEPLQVGDHLIGEHGYHHRQPHLARSLSPVRQRLQTLDQGTPVAVAPMLRSSSVPPASPGLEALPSLRHRRRLTGIVVHPYLCSHPAMRRSAGLVRIFSPQQPCQLWSTVIAQGSEPMTPGLSHGRHALARPRNAQEEQEATFPGARIEEMDDVPANFAEKLQL